MSIQAHLDGLRSQISDCELTAFGDLSSRLILRSSSAKPCQREKLDQLCRHAVESFAKAELVPVTELTDNAVCGCAAVMFSAGKAFVFARPDVTSDEFTCAVTQATSDSALALEATRKSASLIGEDKQ